MTASPRNADLTSAAIQRTQPGSSRRFGRVVLRFRRDGAEVEVIGMTAASATLVDKLSIRDDPDAVKRLMGH